MKRSDVTDFLSNLTPRKKLFLAFVVPPCVLWFAFGSVERTYAQMAEFFRHWARILQVWATAIVFVGNGVLLYHFFLRHRD